VVVGAGAVIPRGCVLSYGVTIGAGAVLPEFTRVARRDADEEVGTVHIDAFFDGALKMLEIMP
jgi:acetyltransferase-like isoleucine patch superfamily enzyme